MGGHGARDVVEQGPEPRVLVRFVAGHFVAGAEFGKASKVCARAAPIIRWMVGKLWQDVKAWCAKKGVEWEVLK